MARNLDREETSSKSAARLAPKRVRRVELERAADVLVPKADPTANPIARATEEHIAAMERHSGLTLPADTRAGLVALARAMEAEFVRELIPLPRTGPPLAEVLRRALAELHGTSSSDMRTHAALEAVEDTIPLDPEMARRWPAGLDRLRRRIAQLDPRLAKLDDEAIIRCFKGAKPRGASRGRGNRGAPAVLDAMCIAAGVMHDTQGDAAERASDAAKRAKALSNAAKRAAEPVERNK